MARQECVLEIHFSVLITRLQASRDWGDFLGSFRSDNIELQKDEVVRTLKAINYERLPLTYHRIKLLQSFHGSKEFHSKNNILKIQCSVQSAQFITEPIQYKDYCVKPRVSIHNESTSRSTNTTYSVPIAYDLKNYTLGRIHQKILDSDNMESAASSLGVSLTSLQEHLKHYHFGGLQLSLYQLKNGVLTRDLLSGVHLTQPSSNLIPADQLCINYWQRPMGDLEQNLSHLPLDEQSTRQMIPRAPLEAHPTFFAFNSPPILQSAPTFFNFTSLNTDQSSMSASYFEPDSFNRHYLNQADTFNEAIPKRGRFFSPTSTDICLPTLYFCAELALEERAQRGAHQIPEPIEPNLSVPDDPPWTFMEFLAP